MIRGVKLSFGTRVVCRVARELGRVVGDVFLPVSSLTMFTEQQYDYVVRIKVLRPFLRGRHNVYSRVPPVCAKTSHSSAGEHFAWQYHAFLTDKRPRWPGARIRETVSFRVYRKTRGKMTELKLPSIFNR